MTTDARRAPAGAALLRSDVTNALQRALLEELASVGYGRLSVEAVARRAGVSKTAVYRRWESKLEMVAGVIAGVAQAKLPMPDTGSLVADLEFLLRFVAKALQHPLALQIILDVLAEAARNPKIAESMQVLLRDNQREVVCLVFRRALERGEIGQEPDLELVVDLMVGSLYWHVAVARLPASRAYVSRLARTMVSVVTAE